MEEVNARLRRRRPSAVFHVQLNIIFCAWPLIASLDNGYSFFSIRSVTEGALRNVERPSCLRAVKKFNSHRGAVLPNRELCSVFGGGLTRAVYYALVLCQC